MSSIEAQRRAHLESKAVAALRARLARQEYMPVLEVAHRLNLSRDKVEEIPREILPYTDFGKKRSLRRYHPADVQAIDARMRAWNSAKEEGRGEEYLAELREQLIVRDEIAIDLTKAVA